MTRWAERLDEPDHGPPDPLHRVDVGTKSVCKPFHHGLDDLLGDLGETGFLGVEVAVEGALGDVRPRRRYRRPCVEESRSSKTLRAARKISRGARVPWG